MNFSLIGIFGSTIIGFIGAFTLMLGHAFTSTDYLLVWVFYMTDIKLE